MKNQITRKNLEAMCPCKTCTEADRGCENDCPKLFDFNCMLDEYDGRMDAARREAAYEHNMRSRRHQRDNDYGKLAKEKRTNIESYERKDNDKKESK